MLTIHQSNRLEALADELSAVIREPLASAFVTEVVVVQSRGVARWLSLELAQRAGVCANVRFPFPNGYAWEIYRAVCGNVPEQSPYDPEVLVWRVLGAIAELETLPSFAPVASYVRGDPARRFELAARLARLYDEYLLYRPDWIARWERARPEHWQAALWRRLVDDAGAGHRAALHAELLKALSAPVAAGALPQRVSFFGAPALPPVTLELFTALARHSDVHLYVQNPCREYWGDIAREGEIARRRLARKPEAQFLEVGNNLLASLGAQGRDFLDLLAGVDGARESDRFVEPGRDTLLGSIQSDILELRERRPDAPVETAPDDVSVQVHSCHSAMREVEVLHDQLLALFSRWPDLEPSDVVVMTPDIETYAPYVEAVFATARPPIPFNVSDRSSERESTIAATLMALLDLRGSRYEAHRVLAILDEASVRRRFGLGEGDVETVRRWARDSQVRWGIDARHRESFGVPPAHEHTWRFGLDRLLLGYALPSGETRLFEGVLSYDEIEGSLGETLGRFASFAEAAIALDTELEGLKPVADWCALLHALLARFFDADEERAEELEAVRGAIAATEKEARAARYTGAVPLATIAAVLRERLELPGRAFLSGGVTFCAMVPMRSLPFEVVCMIGMNDRAYPRVRRRDGFDLMANDFRKGDRSRRDDDRYLFLESVVNAKRCLYVSYTGRHIREDTVMPPSVLVSELLDYLARGYRAAGGGEIQAQVVTQHPLQAFSPRYFRGDARLFSYSHALARAASAAGRGVRVSQPFMAGALPELEPLARSVDLETFVRFFRNPVKHLFETRLHVKLEDAEDELESREPFALQGLPLYRLKEHLLEMRLRGEPDAGVALARAGGILPHGTMGEVLFEAQDAMIDRVAAKTRELAGAVLEPQVFELAGEHVTLTGTLTRLGADGMLIYRVANASAHVRVNAWIRHLALNAFAPRGAGLVSRCVAQDCVLTFSPVADARERLKALLELYWTGMHRPLRFFPRSACEYARQGEVGYKVRNVWTGAYPDYNGEGADPYFALAFRGVDPLDAEFEENARIVFEPMSAALTEEELA